MDKSTNVRTRGVNTRAVHGGQQFDPATGAVTTPIYATSTFAQSAPGVHKGYEYARSQNPTRAAFEAAIADAERGIAGFAFASGLAAEAALLELAEQGSHVVASDDLYGGSWRLFHRVRSYSAGLTITHVDPANLDALRAALRPNTAFIWIETPSNPTLRLADLEAIAAIGREHKVLTVVDNTFASPAVQRPLEHGIDIVVHSVTKYIGGHSDIVGGAIVVRDPELIQKLQFLQNATGGILDPFSSFLALRGIKTLPLRLQRHNANALAVAHWLEAHPKVERVVYPGLASHPQHALATRQMDGGGGMVAAYLKADDQQTVAVLSRFKLFALAESLGAVESLVGQPWSMSHASLPEPDRLARDIHPNLIRLSIGIEDADDLIDDLEQALAVL
ncbi:PLP-dependent aspartate aminotransferase family protein [Rhodopseudomonas sp. HC1]|uniref:trans-sulfuration enzyme family protein n=1 Tax=Rhodopseudomonas infernalis TaxID=2897386 RepID=UPI001EE84976|nr:PLP-dependent aspartate aminotransferase family protein [Rhodopseudomonas infernalis]MCG6203443.1 PLP-dependent aspartate aminotransferase family protein [Rhodopseudomonas infernalis]